ncbi:hypothetical protein LZ318_38290 [Saccharopolyspora indica]|uniref:hypothetical protein n=1 Tax=Saccharopolyspora indica TaxID=1229659 RepID=UPI0022EB2879|nr:hypothetical protein [Saccharopolyspora indica]MDA3642790.1 hypothetical protein [Saccharopolyspora indica]
MAFFPVELGPGFSSELVDLGAVPLSKLRASDDPALHRSLRHVVQQAADIGVTSQGTAGGGERVD